MKSKQTVIYTAIFWLFKVFTHSMVCVCVDRSSAVVPQDLHWGEKARQLINHTQSIS